MSYNRQTDDKIIIVTNSKFGAEVLGKLLGKKIYNVNYEILPKSGQSSALATVKSLLSVRDFNIILLLDSESTDINKIAEEKEYADFYIGSIKRNKITIIWAVPELEIIFIENEKFMNVITDQKLDKNLIAISKNAPKKALATLSTATQEDYLTLLDNEEIIDGFFKNGIIKEISEILEKVPVV